MFAFSWQFVYSAVYKYEIYFINIVIKIDCDILRAWHFCDKMVKIFNSEFRSHRTHKRKKLQKALGLHSDSLKIRKWHCVKNYTCDSHCVKNLRIRYFSGPYFPAFGLNTERYSVFSSNAGKKEPEEQQIRTFFTHYESQT